MIKIFPYLVLSALLVGCGADDIDDAKRMTVISTMPAQGIQHYMADRIYSGRVEAGQTTELGFEMGGQLKTLVARQGLRVKTGETLAVLDTNLLASQAKQLSAKRDEAQANLKLAQASLKRLLGLDVAGYASAQQIDEARTKVAALSAGMSAADRALEVNRVQQDKSVLVAPYAGVIEKEYVDRGAVVAAGSAVYRLVEESAAEILVGVSGPSAKQLAIGQSMPVLLNERQIEGVVISIGASLNPNTQTRDVRLRIAAGDAADGEWARLAVPHRIDLKQPGFWLPMDAITNGIRGTWKVYIFHANEDGGSIGRIGQENVQILHSSDRQHFVTGALFGKTIVANGLQNVVVGQEVQAVAYDASEGLNLVR